MTLRALAFAAMILAAAPGTLLAQSSPNGGLPPSPELRRAADYGRTAARPTICIVAFDTDRTGWVPPPHFGETVADLLASRLVDLGAFRVFDRSLLPGPGQPGVRASFEAIRELARQSGVDFVVLGAVTRFSNEKNHKRGGLLGIPFLGGMSKNTQASALGLSLRVVNVRTGEIVTATIAEGAASKGSRTILAGGIVKGLPVGGGFSSGSTGSLDRLVADALAGAIEHAATTLTNAAAKFPSFPSFPSFLFFPPW